MLNFPILIFHLEELPCTWKKHMGKGVMTGFGTLLEDSFALPILGEQKIMHQTGNISV
jgi:hypothetical protein